MINNMYDYIIIYIVDYMVKYINKHKINVKTILYIIDEMVKDIIEYTLSFSCQTLEKSKIDDNYLVYN